MKIELTTNVPVDSKYGMVKGVILDMTRDDDGRASVKTPGTGERCYLWHREFKAVELLDEGWKRK